MSQPELTDAVAELYRVFARYPLRDDVSYCDHCIAPEDVAALHAVPLHEAPVAMLGRLLMNHSTWGDQEYHLHFLPRLLELVSSGAMNSYGFETFLPAFLYPIRSGPADEHRALDDFFTAWWRATITTWPSRCQPQEILQLVQSCGQLVAPYLAAWATFGGAASVQHLAALVSDLTTGSITDFETRHDIDAWICGPMPEAVLVTAAGTPGPDAADADEALEDLRWFREWYCAPP